MWKNFAKTMAALSVAATALTAPSFAQAHDGGQWEQFCRPYLNNQVHGANNLVRVAMRACAEITNIVRGYDNDVDIRAIGPNMVSVTSLGTGATTRIRVRGADNVLGMIVANGGRSLVRVTGNDNQLGGVNDGCSIKINVAGDDNSVFTDCRAD
ncbi:hypothetical protein [Mesorhizobium sp.]|uniref:hypothetical protein n=1 Tax=Mesorhizobium sp. TaxID=1871066 RepID=UPI000FE35AEF|nr:hypothetical protein [Mesorhizobium sp.]RWK28724.1 MAG: hypothetical protein EOR40_28290 [Mesorhizobium sp.]RWK91037.1 MAG: hypothetical protein EOR52_05765 [Mesorhizobium sp.]TIP17940.1 MAG: hypothetical protein E5X66_19005 [Mesorhizobium sp.]TJV81341.1 MAG: hypothetical protein E5X45_16970 [Mesorhizobium sp.]TJW17216.1 MAG: hypothetical protein E5X42_16145 [Mesorhizobium sp.]